MWFTGGLSQAADLLLDWSSLHGQATGRSKISLRRIFSVSRFGFVRGDGQRRPETSESIDSEASQVTSRIFFTIFGQAAVQGSEAVGPNRRLWREQGSRQELRTVALLSPREG